MSDPNASNSLELEFREGWTPSTDPLGAVASKP